jgi:hypothetical protein
MITNEFDFQTKVIVKYGTDVRFEAQPPGSALDASKPMPQAICSIATKDGIGVGVFDYTTNRGSVYDDVIVRDSCIRTKRIITENARSSQIELTNVLGEKNFISEHNHGIVEEVDDRYAVVRFERVKHGSGIYGQPIEVRLEDLELL